MFEIIPAILIPILPAIIMASSDWGRDLWGLIRSRKRRSARMANKDDVITRKDVKDKLSKIRFWIVLIGEIALIIYVLHEVFSPGAPSKLSIYKIVIGTAAFFFILLQSLISNLFNAIYRMKSADLELTQKLLDPKSQTEDKTKTNNNLKIKGDP